MAFVRKQFVNVIKSPLQVWHGKYATGRPATMFGWNKQTRYIVELLKIFSSPSGRRHITWSWEKRFSYQFVINSLSSTFAPGVRSRPSCSRSEPTVDWKTMRREKRKTRILHAVFCSVWSIPFSLNCAVFFVRTLIKWTSARITSLRSCYTLATKTQFYYSFDCFAWLTTLKASAHVFEITLLPHGTCDR